jgi:hypothetical protein
MLKEVDFRLCVRLLDRDGLVSLLFKAQVFFVTYSTHLEELDRYECLYQRIFLHNGLYLIEELSLSFIYFFVHSTDIFTHTYKVVIDDGQH